MRLRPGKRALFFDSSFCFRTSAFKCRVDYGVTIKSTGKIIYFREQIDIYILKFTQI